MCCCPLFILIPSVTLFRYGDVAYVALKVLTILATWANNNSAGQSSELALHSEIESSFTDGQWPLGSKYCVHPSDFFVAMSECGDHFASACRRFMALLMPLGGRFS
jgi:hypothetical protein